MNLQKRICFIFVFSPREYFRIHSPTSGVGGPYALQPLS